MAEADRIVERRATSVDHQAHLAQLAQWIRDGDPATSPEAADVLDAAAEYIEKQTARIEELEGALRPLAERSKDYGRGYGRLDWAMVTVGDLRRAEAALNTKDQGNG